MHNRCRQALANPWEIPRQRAGHSSPSKYSSLRESYKLTTIQFHNEIFATVRLQLNWKNKTATKLLRVALQSESKKNKNTHTKQKENRKKWENNRNNAQRSENSPMKKSSWQAWPRSPNSLNIPQYAASPSASLLSPLNETCTECGIMFVSKSVCVCGTSACACVCSYIEWTKNKNFFPLE